MIGQRSMGGGKRSGGIERHVEEVSIRLVRMGHEVLVFARRAYSKNHEKYQDGVEIIYSPTIYRKHLENIVHSFFATFVAMRRRADVIHYHGVGAATLAWIPRMLAPRTTVIVTFHSRDRFHKKWKWFARKYLSLGERAAVTLPHYCIAVSHEIQVYCRDTFGKEVVYIPNGANTNQICDRDRVVEFGLEPKNYLLSVGRLVPQKGFDLLMEAFSDLETEMHLAIVGGESFSEQYVQHLRTLAKKDPRMHLLGHQPMETLEALYCDAYLYIHPSSAEGMPLAVLEAMAAGTMPLVSDINENVEAVKYAGETFKAGDKKSLKLKISDLLLRVDRVSEGGEEAMAVAEAYYSWDMIAKHTEGVYITARH